MAVTIITHVTDSVGATATATATADTSSSWNDGSATAPAGPAQLPNILIYAARPPWKVAGVDYAAGPNGTPTGNPTTISTNSSAGIFRSGTVITVQGTDQTLDGYELSGWSVSLNGTRSGITNCHLVANNSDHGVIVHGTDCFVKYCTIDGNAIASWPIRVNNAAGTVVLEHNYLLNSAGDMVDWDFGSNSSRGSLVMQFNLVLGGAAVSGAHADLFQTIGGHFVSETIAFNTWYVKNPKQGTQGIGATDGGSGSTFDVVNVLNNTGIGIGASSIGYFIGGPGGGVIFGTGPWNVNDNYYYSDQNFPGNLFGGGSIPNHWSATRNVRMSDGAMPGGGWNNH